MSYWKGLFDRARVWWTFRQFPKAVRASGKAPSQTYHKYPPFDTFGGKKVLNLGCGKNVYKTENVVNLDGFPGEGVNVVCDLGKGKLPFADQTFDFIIANHVMEHIPNWFETMKEMARVLKVGGEIEIWIPPVSSDASFVYRDHINRIGIESFTGCIGYGRAGTNLAAAEEWKELGHFQSLKIVDLKFRTIITWWTTLSPDWLTKWMVTHLRNVVTEEGFSFRKMAHENPAP